MALASDVTLRVVGAGPGIRTESPAPPSRLRAASALSSRQQRSPSSLSCSNVAVSQNLGGDLAIAQVPGQRRRWTRGTTRAQAPAVATQEAAQKEESAGASTVADGTVAGGESKEGPEEASPKAGNAAEVVAGGKVAQPMRVRRSRDWEKAAELLKNGRPWKCRVEALNDGGLRMRFGSLLGFLPFSQLETNRPAPGAPASDALLGTFLTVQVIEVDESRGRLVVSERKAAKKLRLSELRVGQVWQGVVQSIADYGAFVDLLSPDGKALGVGGLVHVSELSWDSVFNTAAAVSVGQTVRVKVLHLEKGKGRVALSMKQVQSDPLYDTLDALLPTAVGAAGTEQQHAGASDSVLGPQQPLAEELLGAPLPGLQDLCDTLRSQEGIVGISLGRQAMERRVVSQDLELWLSNIPVKDGQFTLVARAGRQVQEVFVQSTLDREGMKEAVLHVTRTLP